MFSPGVHFLMHRMSSALRERYLRALEESTGTVADVAEATGRGYRTLLAYRRGERSVTMEAAQELVSYLRDRNETLQEAAEALEEALQDARREVDDGD